MRSSSWNNSCEISPFSLAFVSASNGLGDLEFNRVRGPLSIAKLGLTSFSSSAIRALTLVTRRSCSWGDTFDPKLLSVGAGLVNWVLGVSVDRLEVDGD